MYKGISRYAKFADEDIEVNNPFWYIANIETISSIFQSYFNIGVKNYLTVISILYIHRPPKVWHHLEHRRHARVLIPTLEY